MGNFEKLSVLVIVVIIVMILVVALYTWTDNPSDGPSASSSSETSVAEENLPPPPPAKDREPGKGGGAAKLTDVPAWPLPPIPPPSGAGEGVKGPAPVPDVPLPPKPVEEPKKDVPVVAAERKYTVKDGDTLGAIAKSELGSASKWPEILKANQGISPESLKVGQVLVIPALASGGGSGSGSAPSIVKVPEGGSGKAGEVYTVRAGETLEIISKKVYGTRSRWPEIWVANLAKLESPDDVHAGMTIQLPR